MQETKDTSLFTELTAEESASVNGAHRYHYASRYRYASRRSSGCDNYSYSPYFDGRETHGYVHNVSYGYYD